MEINSIFGLAGIGAVFGFVASAWGKIKDVAARFIGLFIITVEVDQDLSNYLCGWLMKNCSRWGNYEKTYTSCWEFWRDRRRYGNIASEIYGNRSMLVWYGWMPLYFSVSGRSSGGENKPAQVTMPGQDTVFRLYFLRYTINIDQIMDKAMRWANELNWDIEDGKKNGQASQRFFIQKIPDYRGDSDGRGNNNGKTATVWQYGRYRPIGLEVKDLGWEPPPGDTSLQKLVFPPHVVEVLQEIDRWAKSRDWYVERGIPWKKGCMFYGVPGTGKTAVARAFAQDLDMPLWVYDLSELDNRSLTEAWKKMRHSAPCIALIEDIDNVFHGRENISRRSTMPMFMPVPRQHAPNQVHNDDDNDEWKPPTSPLSFDCLLNVIDGVEENDGVFTIITTNRLEHIDEAIGRPKIGANGETEFISTRPGRIDKAVELKHMTNECKLILAKRIFKDCPQGLSEIQQWISYNPDYQETPAQVQERCAQIALAHYWRERDRKDAVAA